MAEIKRVKNFITQPLKSYINSGEYRRNRRYAHYYENMRVKSNTVLYECREGRSMTGNAYALYIYLKNEAEYKNLKHIWVVDSNEKKTKLEKEHTGENISFVVIHSKEYLKALASSKYLINNSTFPSYFQCKKNQIYINTWHGTPLKYMGKDIIENPLSTKNITRNFVHADYLIMPNRYTTDIFKRAYYLDGIYEGKVLEAGYPRIDFTLNTNSKEFKEKLIKMGINISLDKQLILYAPTWKGSDLNNPNNDLDRIIEDMYAVKEGIDETKYDIVVKVHPFLYKYVQQRTDMQDICIDDAVDTNMLLSTVDILVTDYSSIFFDYLVTKKPILFYMWDKSDYEENRGLYIEDKELPGPSVCSTIELAHAINNIDSIAKEYAVVYEQAVQKFSGQDDGNATKRIVDIIFNKKTNEYVYSLKDEKETILMYLGGMKNNGITSSAINLLNNIDYSKYNVSVLVAGSQDNEIINNIQRINENVKKFIRVGKMNFTLNESYREKYIMAKGKNGKLGNMLYPNKLFKREFNRLFGSITFDYIIDFSGYSMFWNNIILQGKAKKKIIYMHNDLLADSKRTINGKKVHEQNLNGVFSLLKEFDAFGSVSPACRDINKKNLGKYASADKFKYILNSINTDKILEGRERPSIIFDEQKYLICHKVDAMAKGINMKVVPMLEQEYINIVSLGNIDQVSVHSSIINVLATVKNSKIRLYVVGYEKLSAQLQEYIQRNSSRLEIVVLDNITNMSGLLGLSDYIIYNDATFKDYRYISQLNMLQDKWNKTCFVYNSIDNKMMLENDNIQYIDNIEEVVGQLQVKKQESYKELLELVESEVLQIIDNGEACILGNKKYFFSECKELIGCKEIVVKELPNSDKINFINIGRLSPEKDQEKLIYAFKRVNDKYSNTCLYILGEGPLYSKLQSLIDELELGSCVFLMGQVSNPFYLLNKCNCFVLSSNYEGQPMVLLEAMTLGKNIIATDIPQNRYVLQDGYGRLAKNNISGLVKEMERFVEQGMEVKEFNYDEYNKKAMETFYNILEV